MAWNKASRAFFLTQLSIKNISFEIKDWANYMQDVVQRNAVIVEIDSVEQLQQTIQMIKAENEKNKDYKITVRAAAGWKDEPSRVWCCFPWKQKQSVTYNESFSFSGGAKADVIVRFSKKFHTIKLIEQLEGGKQALVEVSAGVQISELSEWLRHAKPAYSLSTVSMIAWVTAVGLAVHGGHGTGREQPAFSGLIQRVTVCDMNGNIREIASTEDCFTALCGAHHGLLGVVINITLRVDKAFNLEEQIRNYKSVGDLNRDLSHLMANEYFTLMRIPTYPSHIIKEHEIDKWHIRLWNKTDKKRTQYENAPYVADASSLAQELEVRIGGSIQEFLLDMGLQRLFPMYMALTASIVTGSRGAETRIDYENNITHYQVAFPKSLHDVSYFIPVKDSEASDILAKILSKVDDMLHHAGERGEYPVTYAMYVRYLKGTNGGLSMTATSHENERILAIDFVTHPNAPGIERFEEDFLGYLTNELEIRPRFHLGKHLPRSVTHYGEFMDQSVLEEHRAALIRWYGGEEQLKKSPFITPVLQAMMPHLQPGNIIDITEVSSPSRRVKHDEKRCCEFLGKLIKHIKALSLTTDEQKDLRLAFISECETVMTELTTRSSLLCCT